MSAPGWYPDPGGQAGMFRWWDGRQWSTSMTANPQTTPPPTGNGPMGGAAPLGGGASGNPYEATESRGAPWGWIAVAGAIMLVIALALWLLLGRGAPGSGGGGDRPEPGAPASQDPCPMSKPRATPRSHPDDGRVHGGKLSYPMQPAPWRPVSTDTRVPFAVDVAQQVAVIEPDYNGKASWVAAMLVAELVAGDGFFAPKDGATIVATCVLGKFYGDNVLQRKDIASKAITVDGRKAWLLEFHLSFDIPNLKTKGETVFIVVVDTPGLASSLYFASVPDGRDDLLKTARDMISRLKVDD